MDPRVGVPQEVKVLLRDRFKGSWWSNSTGLNSWDTGGFGGGTLVDFHDEKKNDRWAASAVGFCSTQICLSCEN